MIRVALILVLALALLPTIVSLAAHLALRRGAWRLARTVGRAAPYVLGRARGRSVAFLCEVLALRESAQLEAAANLARACVADATAAISIRNAAVDVLISAGRYEAALRAEPTPEDEDGDRDRSGRTLIQLNLAEAEYNLGRWDAAEERLRFVEAACEDIPLTRTWLRQQRAWIAAHRGRPSEALALCRAMQPRDVPGIYRSECHFTFAAALLAAGRLEEAEAAVARGERVARRRSSRRNALFLRARIAAARGDWVSAERFCRAAADHRFLGQGGDGLLLWAEALAKVGRVNEVADTLRLVTERDPESEAARTAAARLNSFRNELTIQDSTL